MITKEKYAIISTGGKQYTVSEGDKLEIELIDAKPGQKVSFEEVLMLKNKSKTTVGTPFVKNAKVDATVESEIRGEKIKVFKKKRRKGYKKTTGHRQNYHVISVDSISAKAPAKKSEPKAEVAAKATVAKKPAAAKKPATKKTTAKKADKAE